MIMAVPAPLRYHQWSAITCRRWSWIGSDHTARQPGQPSGAGAGAHPLSAVPATAGAPVGTRASARSVRLLGGAATGTGGGCMSIAERPHDPSRPLDHPRGAH